ncbi:TonB system transport protein ExbD [Helicobacter sp. MIT 00-7814]|uniref:TonB system transport protein ExbD n=1 Tax=unclassified Helicobacter TaxID=2593540 RepID=UPI000E1E5F7C|nr:MULTISPECIES: TonB system transport protein ExbD [unclassified Helicobacter]RDU53553.1 TonB system transport protein ExbD [Helicobacter sp. MIT 00-7814]RDU57021.1 TonB system transport protein ExbD [Helicobacter sp. MIT 99-10781]
MRLPKKDGLNVIPLIDVMLVLLAIVLSVSTFIVQGQIKVDLPSSQSQSVPTDSPTKLLAINEQCEIFFENELVNMEVLREKIFALDPKTMLKLEVDKNARFDVFVQVADILKEKGHENVSIATTKKQ